MGVAGNKHLIELDPIVMLVLIETTLRSTDDESVQDQIEKLWTGGRGRAQSATERAQQLKEMGVIDDV